MFTTEQYINQKARNGTKNSLFKAGMPLAKGKVVKAKFTYRELTLLIGIFVALLIAFTLWSNGYKNILDEHSSVGPAMSIPTIVNIVVESFSAFWL